MIAVKGLCGLSGVAHGLMAVCALDLMAQGEDQLVRRVGMGSFVLLLSKCLIEVLPAKCFLPSSTLASSVIRCLLPMRAACWAGCWRGSCFTADQQRLYVSRPRAMMRPMTTPNQQVRRATVEDLQKLMPLWQRENLPAQDLEKRFKEFQVVQGHGGELLGAVGLQIAGAEGCLHSEVFAHHEQADALRQQL